MSDKTAHTATAAIWPDWINRKSIVIMAFFLTLFPAIAALTILGLDIGDNGRIDVPLRLFYLWVILFGAASYKLVPKYLQPSILGAGLASCVYGLISSGIIIHNNLVFPHEWDFLCWYLDGSVTARGLNPYQPEVYAKVLHELELPFVPSMVFELEIIRVGSKYPPPMMLYFLPLGYLDFQSAHLLWTFMNLVIMGAIIWLIRGIFFQSQGLVVLILSIGILLLYPSSRAILFHEQLYFLVLFFGLLAWRDRDLSRSGCWIMLGAVVKPIFGLILLYHIFRREWRTVWVGVLTIAGMLALTILALGFDPVLSYVMDNPNTKVPSWQYTQWMNQSLLATVLRWFQYDFSNGSPVLYPIFLLTAGSLTAASAWIIVMLQREHLYIALGLTTALAVLIYPGSLKPYSILLLPTLVYLYVLKDKIPQGYWGVPCFLALLGAIMYVQAFFANLLIWLSLASVAFFFIKSRERKNLVLT